MSYDDLKVIEAYHFLRSVAEGGRRAAPPSTTRCAAPRPWRR